MSYSTIERTAVTQVEVNPTNTAAKQSCLSAQWLVEDGKLICKWSVVNLE